MWNNNRDDVTNNVHQSRAVKSSNQLNGFVYYKLKSTLLRYLERDIISYYITLLNMLQSR